jgi:hypothetical protein
LLSNQRKVAVVELGPTGQTSEYDRINRSVAVFIKIEAAGIRIVAESLTSGRGESTLPTGGINSQLENNRTPLSNER